MSQSFLSFFVFSLFLFIFLTLQMVKGGITRDAFTQKVALNLALQPASLSGGVDFVCALHGNAVVGTRTIVFVCVFFSPLLNFSNAAHRTLGIHTSVAFWQKSHTLPSRGMIWVTCPCFQ